MIPRLGAILSFSVGYSDLDERVLPFASVSSCGAMIDMNRGIPYNRNGCCALIVLFSTTSCMSWQGCSGGVFGRGESAMASKIISKIIASAILIAFVAVAKLLIGLIKKAFHRSDDSDDKRQ